MSATLSYEIIWCGILSIEIITTNSLRTLKNTEDALLKYPEVSKIQPRFNSLCKLNTHIHL